MQKLDDWNQLWTDGVDLLSVVGPAGSVAFDETSIALVRAAPGSAPVPPHHHRVSTEIYLVVSGRGEVTVGGARSAVGPGSVVLIETGEVHTIVPVGDEELVYWAVSTPAWRIEDHVLVEGEPEPSAG